MSQDEKIKRKKIEATKQCKKLMADHFLEMDEAVKTGSRKIAWCTSVGPAEILRGMGFLVYFPENHGAMLGATRMATELIPHANALGYSPDICSYLTADVGSFIRKKTPLTMAYQIESVPKPDVLVFNTNQCRDVQDWFAWYARELQAPLLGVHTHRDIGDIGDLQIKDIAGQIKELIPPLEEISGEKFDMDRFKEAVGYSRRTSELWRACLEASAAIPSPWTFFDTTILMGPAVVARGTREAVEYYETAPCRVEGTDQGRGGRGGRGEVQALLGRNAHMGETPASLRTVFFAQDLCRGLHVLQQLDLRPVGPRGAVREHGARLHRTLHSKGRALQGTVYQELL